MRSGAEMRCVELLEPPHNGFLSDVANLLTWLLHITPPPRKGVSSKSSTPLVYSSPPPPILEDSRPSSGITLAHLYPIWAQHPPPLLPYLASVHSLYLYFTISDYLYTPLILSSILWRVCFINSYLRSLPYTNTHPQCYYIAVYPLL